MSDKPKLNPEQLVKALSELALAVKTLLGVTPIILVDTPDKVMTVLPIRTSDADPSIRDAVDTMLRAALSTAAAALGGELHAHAYCAHQMACEVIARLDEDDEAGKRADEATAKILDSFKRKDV